MSAEHLDQLFGLHGKVALVTGASSGLGVEFAQGLALVLGEGANAVHKTIGYAATKGAVTNMTRQLEVEWAPYGITVNALAPAGFPTDMITDPRLGRVHEAQQTRMELFTPMGRLGRDGELLGAIIFLASPAASYVTGEILHVDGGWRGWGGRRGQAPCTKT